MFNMAIEPKLVTRVCDYCHSRVACECAGEKEKCEACEKSFNDFIVFECECEDIDTGWYEVKELDENDEYVRTLGFISEQDIILLLRKEIGK